MSSGGCAGVGMAVAIAIALNITVNVIPIRQIDDFSIPSGGFPDIVSDESICAWFTNWLQDKDCHGY
jgi:hypothetical protein